MSRSGSNNGGRGGRDFRLNWSIAPGPGGDVTFGDWSVLWRSPGTSFPWTVFYKGSPVLQASGDSSAHRRFKTPQNAMRWVERELRQREATGARALGEPRTR